MLTQNRENPTYSLNGYYLVNNEIIPNKLNALIKATELGSDVHYYYYNNIFSETAARLPSDVSSVSLEELYKQRALQIRETYDYVILNYSGGSDSHNILHTFLKYNIKLDMVYVQWPERLMDKGLYTPNVVDKSNSNFHSEWDFVLKRDLEWLGKNKPDIKIEISDWTTTVTETFYKDDIFNNQVSNLPSIARAQKQNTFSKTEGILASQGKKVASIFGIDKPCIIKKNDRWYFYFMDTACMAQPNPENPYGTEYFYWSPNFPEIAVVQGHKMIEWFKKNPSKQYLITAKSERFAKKDPSFINFNYNQYYAEHSEIQEIAKIVCYPHWDFNRFQAAKPYAVLEGFKMGTRAWDNILTSVPNFERVQQSWEYHWKSYLSVIDTRFLRNQDTLGVIRSQPHRLI